MPPPLTTSANTVCLSGYMKCLKPLFTKIRDKETEHLEFVKYANRLMSVICEEGFAYSRALSSNQGASVASSSTTVCAESDESTVIIQTSAGECMIKTPRGGTYPSPAAAVAASASAAVATVTTPTNSVFIGVKTDLSSVIAVSIIRAGDSMLDTFLSLVPEAKTGKILIQRNEMTSQPKLFYTKLPRIPSHSTVVILDPMLATGGSAIIAVKEILLQTQALERNILFICVVAAPEGIAALHAAHPEVFIVAGEIDTGLNQMNYIIPGLGDYGDRFYGTN